MTDRTALFQYRWNLAIETLTDAQKMIAAGVSSRSVVNRAYYAMLYAVLALFIRTGIQSRTSRHSGVIGIFDAEFIKTGKLPKEISRTIHRAFDDRQEYDYKDYSHVDSPEAEEMIASAESFILRIKNLLESLPVVS
jgi:uncharacterized protein (UPF0332 family)